MSKMTIKKDITSLVSYFYNKGYTEIPNGLLDNNINIITMGACFAYNNITSIPMGLFDNNVNIISVWYCFYNNPNLTTVPPGLFDNLINCRAYGNIFTNCALSRESIDNVLISIDNSGSTTTTGSIGLDGGTNSNPSKYVIDNIIPSLESKGWFVHINKSNNIIHKV